MSRYTVECLIAPHRLVVPDCKFCHAIALQLSRLGNGEHRLTVSHGFNWHVGYWLSIELDGSILVEFATSARLPTYDNFQHAHCLQMLAQAMDAHAAIMFISHDQWQAIQIGDAY